LIVGLNKNSIQQIKAISGTDSTPFLNPSPKARHLRPLIPRLPFFPLKQPCTPEAGESFFLAFHPPQNSSFDSLGSGAFCVVASASEFAGNSVLAGSFTVPAFL